MRGRRAGGLAVLLGLLAAGALAAVEEDVPDATRQPDRPPPAARGFLTLPDIMTQEEAVTVDGFRLLPLGPSDGWLEIHPQALAGVGWDSNPLQAGDGSDGDVFTRYGVGFTLRAFSRDGWRADVDAMLDGKEYGSTGGRDLLGGTAQASVSHGNDLDRLSLRAGFERTSEPLIEVPEQVGRDRFNAGLAASREAGGARWSGRLGVDTLNYLEDTVYFGRDERDYRRWSAGGGWHLTGANDSLLGAVAEAAVVQRPSDATTNEGESLLVQGQWRHAFGGRSALDLRLGASASRFSAASLGDPGNDDRRLVAPAINVQGVWGWEERSWVELGLISDVTEGVTASSNASRRLAALGQLQLRLRDRLDLVAMAWLSHRTDTGATATQGTETITDTYLRTGCDYRLRDGLGLKLWAAWVGHRSRIAQDYDETLLGLTLVAAL